MLDTTMISPGTILKNLRCGYKYKILQVRSISTNHIIARYFCFTTNTELDSGFFNVMDYVIESNLPATPIDKQAAVIAKIKYLDKRYHDRRNLAA